MLLTLSYGYSEYVYPFSATDSSMKYITDLIFLMAIVCTYIPLT